MHSPSIILSILGNVHNNFTQATTNTRFIDRTRKAIKAIPIRELEEINR